MEEFFPKVRLGRRFDPVAAGAKIYPVHVELEDLILCQLALDAKGNHRFEQLAADGPAAQWKAVARELLCNAARAFLDRAALDVAVEGPRHPAPIDSAMLVEACVFAYEQRLDKERRNFFERDLQPVGAGKAAVDLAVDVEDGIALRHRAETLQVEGLCPDGIEGQDRSDEGERKRDKKKGKDPTPAAAVFLAPPRG